MNPTSPILGLTWKLGLQKPLRHVWCGEPILVGLPTTASSSEVQPISKAGTQ